MRHAYEYMSSVAGALPNPRTMERLSHLTVAGRKVVCREDVWAASIRIFGGDIGWKSSCSAAYSHRKCPQAQALIPSSSGLETPRL